MLVSLFIINSAVANIVDDTLEDVSKELEGIREEVVVPWSNQHSSYDDESKSLAPAS
jgi:hypothetical protein